MNPGVATHQTSQDSKDGHDDPGTQGASGSGGVSGDAFGGTQDIRDIGRSSGPSSHGEQNGRTSNPGTNHGRQKHGQKYIIPTCDDGELIYDQENMNASLSVPASPMELNSSPVFQALDKKPMISGDGVEKLFFQTLRWLGRGASGTVDEVLLHGSISSMARKVVSCRTPSQYDRLRTEIFIMKRMQHPHIVRFVAAYRSNHSTYTILMNPAADYSLFSMLQARPSRSAVGDESWKWFSCLVSGLNYMHSQNTIHGNIKPANILVKNNLVYITDFGLSRCLLSDLRGSSSQNSTSLYSADPGIITARYAAPEMHRVVREKSSDIFSLGCVFLELLTWLLSEFTARSHFDQQAIQYNVLRGIPYSQNMENVVSWCSVLRRSAEQCSERNHSLRVLQLIQSMLTVHPKQRPTIVALQHVLTPQLCCLTRELEPPAAFADMILQPIVHSISYNFESLETTTSIRAEWSQEPRTKLGDP